MAARPDLSQMAEKVLQLLEPELAAEGYEILDVRVFQGGGRFQVRIYVDLTPDGGITLDECARAGRTVNMLMEEADLFSGQYLLEVSSPGIRRPLRLARHYEAVVGQRVDLKVRMPRGSRRLRGELLAVEGKTLRVQTPAAEGEEVEIQTVDLVHVLEANLDPEFDAKALINADRRKKKDEKRERRQSRAKTKKSRPKSVGKKGKPGSSEEP